MRRLGRTLGASGTLFLVACVCVQFVPLLDVLGYEYAALVGALVSLLGAPRIAWRTRLSPSDSASRWRVAARHGAQLSAAVAVAGGISLLNGLRVMNCEPWVGVRYLVIFGFGAVPMAVALGMTGGLLSRRRGVVLVFALLLASAVSSLATLALQPAIVVYDTFFGYYAGSIYDESLTGMGTHVAYRLWGACWAIAALALLERARRPGRRDAWLAAGAIACGLALFAARGPIGLDRGRAYVVQTLGGHVATEHFDIYFDAERTDARAAELLAYDHEAQYARQAAFWGVEPDRRLRSFVYADRDQKGALMGGRSTLVAKIWLGEMHITWGGVGDTLLAHEMAHLFLRRDGVGPLSLASSDGLLPIMALVEGAATAAAWGGNELDAHYWSAAIYRLELGEDISELLGPAGFWSRYSRRAYTLTGSFARWLIDTRGPAAFRAAYQRGDFAGAYGQPLSSLMDEWRAFLGGLELTPSQLEAARFRFDRPSMFGRRCARSIATRLDEGEAFVRAGNVEDATRCFEGIVADDPTNGNVRLKIAQAYAGLGVMDRARSHASALVEEEGNGAALRARADELLADLAWRAGDADAAAVDFARLAGAAGTSGDRRRLRAKATAAAAHETHPMTSVAVRNALAADPPVGRVASAIELAEAWRVEGHAIAGYLLALRLAADPGTAALARLVEDIPRAALTPGQQLRLTEAVALHQTRAGRASEACEAWREVAAAADPGSASRADAEAWVARCDRRQMPEPPSNATP